MAKQRSILAAVCTSVVVAACGGTTAKPRPGDCLLKAQQAVAKDLGISTGAITFAKSVGTNGMPQCDFTARKGAHKVSVLVNIDNGPSAYFRLLRTVAEAGQVFGPPPPGFHAPEGIGGLGPFASWFVNNHQLMATNRVDLLTVTVQWPGASRNSEVAAARAAIVPYLARKHGRGNANDYP